jgi:hypothetical protein
LQDFKLIHYLYTVFGEKLMIVNQEKRAMGIFSTRAEAERTLDALNHSGFPMEKVSLIARDADHQADIAGVNVQESVGNKADEGASAGAVPGGVVGGGTGLLIGLGTLAIPGIGPILLAGAAATALATTVAGTVIGAAAGGVVGALIVLGIPEERAKAYSDHVAKGGYLVLVDGSEAEIARAETLLQNQGIREFCIYDAPTLSR